MDVPWEALCEAYLHMLRGQLAARMAESVARGRHTQAEAERLFESGDFFKVYNESVCCATFATASVLEHWKTPTSHDIRALEMVLADPERMHFVKALAWQTGYVPPVLLSAFTRGAVYTRCPSVNRTWIELAVPIDPVVVRNTLLNFVERGTALEVTGAANAFYWFDVALQDLALDHLRDLDRRRAVCLTRFVELEDVEARRSLGYWVNWNLSACAAAARPTLARAIEIAKGHDDPIIRQWYEHGTGRFRRAHKKRR